MHANFLLKDLAVIMTIAAFVMYLFQRLRQPAIIGYLLAGVIIGPYTPPFSLVSDIGSIRSISELGLVFLMFSLGLEFNLSGLRRAGLPATVSALVVVLSMTFTGAAAGRGLGWPLPASLLLGAILSISGSTIIAKVLFDMKLTQEPFAKAVFGLMICDDIAAMVILSVISGLGAHAGGLAAGTATTFVSIMFFMLLFLTLGLLLVPRILARVAELNSTETLGISVLGLCFASAFIAAHFKFSIALGTFLMGAIVAATPQIDDVEEWTLPLRDMFSALFFVSAGMLVNPRDIVEHWGAVLVIGFLAVAGRSFWGMVASVFAGYDLKMSAKIGLSSAQIGEFSFILAAAGTSAGISPDWLYGVTVAIATGTTFLYPYIMRNMNKIEDTALVLVPVRIQSAVASYRAAVWSGVRAGSGEHNPVFSRYAMRLVLYITLVAGFLFAGSSAADYVHANASASFLGFGTVPALWLPVSLFLIPLLVVVSRYFGHIFLLFITVFLQKMPARLAGSVNIRLLYSVANVFFLAVMGGLVIFFLSGWFTSDREVLLFVCILLLCALLLKRLILVCIDLAENLLDQVIGLATSEPFHRTIASEPGGKAILRHNTVRWFVADGSNLSGRTIRELDIRSRTGASVISIYRNGSAIVNPAPDSAILPGDILIIFGSSEQCLQSEEFLKSWKA